MSQVIVEDQDIISRTWITWLRTILFGIAVGVAFWLLTIIVDRYVIEPLACRQIGNGAVCLNSISLSGNIAALLIGALAVLAMVRMSVARPIIVAVAALGLLWDLASWTSGLYWAEALGWSALLYGLAYGLFSWISRYAALWVAIAISVVIIVVVRVSILL